MAGGGLERRTRNYQLSPPGDTAREVKISDFFSLLYLTGYLNNKVKESVTCSYAKLNFSTASAVVQLRTKICLTH